MLLLIHVSLLSWSGVCHIPNLGGTQPQIPILPHHCSLHVVVLLVALEVLLLLLLLQKFCRVKYLVIHVSQSIPFSKNCIAVQCSSSCSALYGGGVSPPATSDIMKAPTCHWIWGRGDQPPIWGPIVFHFSKTKARHQTPQKKILKGNKENTKPKT